MYLQNEQLTYVSVPKCACSSVKLFLFHIENGFRFKPFTVDGTRYRIHSLSTSLSFADLPHEDIKTHVKFAIVRDPLSRVLSCYEDKILSGEAFRNNAAAAKARAAGLELVPSFEAFVDKLEMFQQVSPVVHRHSQLLSFYLGNQPEWYDRIFDISALGEMRDFVCAHTGTSVALPHKNKTTKVVDRAAISGATKDKINSLFANDIELYGKWFEPVAGPA